MADLQSFWIYHATLFDICVILLCGFCGGLAKDLVRGRMFLLPRKEGQKLYLGTLGSMILGIIMAFLIDGSPLLAFSSALAAPYIIEELLDTIKKRNKIKNDEQANSEENE